MIDKAFEKFNTELGFAMKIIKHRSKDADELIKQTNHRKIDRGTAFFLNTVAKLDLEYEEKIIEIVRKTLYQLWDIKNETLWKTLHRWIFRYDERSMNIKVELNKRIRNSNTYNFQNIDGIKIRCMAPGSIFANKLVALYERFKNRDLYDVNFFLKNKFPINDEIIAERTWKNIKQLVEELIELLPIHYQQNNILAELWEVLTDPQKIWMKNRALDETIDLLQNLL